MGPRRGGVGGNSISVFVFGILLHKFLAHVRKASGKNRTETGRGTHTHAQTHTFYIYHADFLEVGIKLRFAERPALGPSGNFDLCPNFLIYFDWFCRCRHIHTYTTSSSTRI